MKFFAVTCLSLVLMVASSGAAPQYGGGGGRPQPQRQCKTINDVQYVEKFEQICDTVYDYQLCVPTYSQQCDQKRRQKCNDNYRTVYDTVYENHCEDVWSNECEKIWKDDGYGGKVWEEDKTSCKDVKRSKCADVPKQVPRQEKYETCDWENYQDCYQVQGQHDCQQADESYCYQREAAVKGAECKQKPRKACKQVHKEVPTQVSRQVCEGDADWEAVRDGTYSVNNNVRTQVVGTKDVAVPNVRQGDVDIEGLDNEREPEKSEEAEGDDDAIVFGR